MTTGRVARHPATFAASALLVVLALAARFGQPLGDPDTGWNLRSGAWIWEHRQLPAADPLLHTSGQSLPAAVDAMFAALPDDPPRSALRSHWLGQLSMYAAWRLGGERGVSLWFALCWALLCAAVWQAGRDFGLDRRWALCGVAFAIRRNIPLLALAILPALLWTLRDALERSRWREQAPATALLLASLFALLPLAPLLQPPRRGLWHDAFAPRELARFLDGNAPPGQPYNPGRPGRLPRVGAARDRVVHRRPHALAAADRGLPPVCRAGRGRP